MLDAAVRPLDSVRTARIIFEASRRTRCFAASKPRPVLEPVIIIVFPANE